MSAALLARAEPRHTAISAGTSPADQIHPVVIDVMLELGIDLTNARPKVLTAEMAALADVIVTMGCGDGCPVIPGIRYVDWNLPDPKDMPLSEARRLRDEIDRRVATLIRDLQ